MYCENCGICTTKLDTGLVVSDVLFEYLRDRNFRLSVTLGSSYDCHYGAPSHIINELSSLLDVARKNSLLRFKHESDRVCVKHKEYYFLLCISMSENNTSCDISLIK